MMAERLILSMIWMVMFNIQLQLSLGNPLHDADSTEGDRCTISRAFKIFGHQSAPDCQSHTTCARDSDCARNMKCECNDTCGLVCTCPPPNNTGYFMLFGNNVSRCVTYHQCHDTSDCASLSRHGTNYECVCNDSCGMVCQAIPSPHATLPTDPLPRPGICPIQAVSIQYNFEICRFNQCEADVHCLDPRRKCCQTSCRKRCLLSSMPSDDTSSSPCTTTVANGEDGSGASRDRDEVDDNGDYGPDEYDAVTDFTTDIMSYDMTTEVNVHEDHTHIDSDDGDYGSRNHDGRRSSRDLCSTGMPQDGVTRGASCNPSHRCRRHGHHPICGSNGVTYANQCFLRRAHNRAHTPISMRYTGHCHQAQQDEAEDRVMVRRRPKEDRRNCLTRPCLRRKTDDGSGQNLSGNVPGGGEGIQHHRPGIRS